MASDERNALAELAERLKFDVDELSGKHRDHLGIYQCVTDDVRKAQRIIAELANVKCQPPEYIVPYDGLAFTAYATCRGIAEEGANNG